MNDRRSWELAILARATRFVVSTPVEEPRAPGQRMRWRREEFVVHDPRLLSRAEVLKLACAYARSLGSPRVLVYAVDDSVAPPKEFPLSRGDWL